MALVLLAAGCGNGKATIDRAELPHLVLQPADMQGFDRFDEGRQLRLDAVPGPREDPGRFGREEGWKARYRSLRDMTSGPAVVESRADLFSSEGGATKDLAAYAEQLDKPIPGSGMTLRKLDEPELGDAALGVEMRQGPALFFVVAWRKANATASVLVQGRVGSLRPADVLAVAKRQARHLEKAAAS